MALIFRYIQKDFNFIDRYYNIKFKRVLIAFISMFSLLCEVVDK